MSVRVNYDQRIFQPMPPPDPGVSDGTGLASPPALTGDVGPDTRFQYHQHGDVVWATYSGGTVRFGTLIATADADGVLDVRYQQVSESGTMKTGRCRSTPEFLLDGRIRLHEDWTWTEGADGSGHSIVEEI